MFKTSKYQLLFKLQSRFLKQGEIGKIIIENGCVKFPTSGKTLFPNFLPRFGNTNYFIFIIC